MTNKLTEFFLAHFPQIIEMAKDKIEELEKSMTGAEGQAKKEALDAFMLDKIAELIRNWDIPQVPNIIENNYLDPATIKMVEIYLPKITQGVYNTLTANFKK